MGDASGQGADRLYFSGMLKLGLKLLFIFFSLLSLGDILNEKYQNPSIAGAILDADLDIVTASIFATVLGLETISTKHRNFFNALLCPRLFRSSRYQKYAGSEVHPCSSHSFGNRSHWPRSTCHSGRSGRSHPWLSEEWCDAFPRCPVMLPRR